MPQCIFKYYDTCLFRFLFFQTPETMYTEGDVKALKEQHAVEIQLLQEEYE